MAIISDQSQFIFTLLELLGLDGKQVTGFTLRAEVGKIVTLDVTQFADVDDRRIVELKKYTLTTEEINDSNNDG